jgi:hypothetical protein
VVAYTERVITKKEVRKDSIAVFRRNNRKQSLNYCIHNMSQFSYTKFDRADSIRLKFLKLKKVLFKIDFKKNLRSS